MKRAAFIVLVAGILGATAWQLAAIWGRTHARADGSRRTAVAAEGPIEDTVDANGSVAALNRVEIRPPIGGRMDQLLVDEGARVKAGQIIAWMSSNDRAAILDAARAQGPQEFAHWQDAYKPTPIVAPLSGTIILRNVVVGQTVDPTTVLYAVADELIVVAQVDESDIGRVKLGMPSRIVLDAYANAGFDGKVFDILHEGKNVSNVITYGVKIRPSRVPSFVRSQMTASVSFILGRKDKAVLIPAAAIRQQPDGTRQVMVPGPDGKPVAREVKTGIESGEKVEIVEGVVAGDEVLLRGRYAPPQAPASSPLSFGGRPSGNPQGGGGAPRQRRSAP